MPIDVSGFNEIPSPPLAKQLEEDYGKSANANREKKRPRKSFELELVEQLINSLPPIITLGERWFVCHDGL
jgi:hypothetical protein